MNKHKRWLLQELDRWVAGGIVSSEQARNIRDLYPHTRIGPAWGTLVLPAMGVVIAALGVILLLAYNWHAIPRLVKLAIILGAAGGAHAAGIWRAARAGEGARPNATEVLCLLGTMLFGAGIWLVAQIYHIDEHYPRGFLLWGLGALAMAWALPSIPQALVATVTFTIWTATEAAAFSRPADAAALLLAGGIAPLAWRRNSPLLSTFTILGLFAVLAVNAGHWGGMRGAFVACLAFAVLLEGASRCLQQASPTRAGLATAVHFPGMIAFLVLLYALTFEGAADELTRPRAGGGNKVVAACYLWGLTLAALVPWTWLLARAGTGRMPWPRLDCWLIPLVLLAAAAPWDGEAIILTIIANVVAFLLAAFWMVQGCLKAERETTLAGSLLLAAVVLARFFDLFDSLAMRGLAFVMLGALLVAEGFYFRQRRRALTTGSAK